MVPTTGTRRPWPRALEGRRTCASAITLQRPFRTRRGYGAGPVVALRNHRLISLAPLGQQRGAFIFSKNIRSARGLPMNRQIDRLRHPAVTAVTSSRDGGHSFVLAGLLT